jgi:hypothetical protein
MEEVNKLGVKQNNQSKFFVKSCLLGKRFQQNQINNSFTEGDGVIKTNKFQFISFSVVNTGYEVIVRVGGDRRLAYTPVCCSVEPMSTS